MTTTTALDVCPSCRETYAASGACGCDVDGHAPGSGRRYRVDLTKHTEPPPRRPALGRLLTVTHDTRPRPDHHGGTCHCGAAVEGRFVCPSCIDVLRWSLTQVPDVVAGLDALRVQRGIDYRTLGGTTGGSDEIPWPINADAMLARDRLRQVLARLTYTAARDRIGPQPRTGVPSFLDPVAMADYLLGRVDRLATRPGFETAAHELASAIGRADTMTTPRAQRQRLGACVLGCGGVMAAVVGEQFATCEACEVTTPAQPLRDGTLAEVADRRLTATEIARLVTYFGLVGETSATKVRDRIYTWFKRGRIHRAVDLNRPPAPAFVFADVYVQLVVDQAGAGLTVVAGTPRPIHLCCRTNLK